jgi:dual specificity tyrosine-phosphorylation-regulated kinase 2/3/4
VWSLGCLILEIVSAVPLWMPHKSLIGTGADHIVRSGIFVVRERALDKIVEKQEKFVK